MCSLGELLGNQVQSKIQARHKNLFCLSEPLSAFGVSFSFATDIPGSHTAVTRSIQRL